VTLTREYLEGVPEVRHLPGNYRLLGALAGIPIVEGDPRVLKYNEMYFGEGTQGLVVGEIRHFMYRMKQIDLNQQARDAARRHIEKTWERLFGEPHPEVSPF